MNGSLFVSIIDKHKTKNNAYDKNTSNKEHNYQPTKPIARLLLHPNKRVH